VVVLLHAPGCERAESFVPTLSRIAEKVPGLAYGRIDVAQGGSGDGLATKFGVQLGAPSLRAMFRNAPPHQRMLEYRGPPTYEAVLPWAEAVGAWDGGEALPTGWEVGTEPAPERDRQSEKSHVRAASVEKRKKKAKSKDEV
jgi:hypothetical protein